MLDATGTHIQTHKLFHQQGDTITVQHLSTHSVFCSPGFSFTHCLSNILVLSHLHKHTQNMSAIKVPFFLFNEGKTQCKLYVLHHTANSPLILSANDLTPDTPGPKEQRIKLECAHVHQCVTLGRARRRRKKARKMCFYLIFNSCHEVFSSPYFFHEWGNESSARRDKVHTVQGQSIHKPF